MAHETVKGSLLAASTPGLRPDKIELLELPLNIQWVSPRQPLDSRPA